MVADLSAGTPHVPVPSGIDIGAGAAPVPVAAHLSKPGRLPGPADPPVTTTVAYSNPQSPATFIQSSPSAVTLPIDPTTSTEPGSTTTLDGTVPPPATTTVPPHPPSVTTTTDDGSSTDDRTTTTVGTVPTNPSTTSTTDQ
jgi:hypothetical protein